MSEILDLSRILSKIERLSPYASGSEGPKNIHYIFVIPTLWALQPKEKASFWTISERKIPKVLFMLVRRF